MKVLVNAVSARMGGAANYLRHVLPELEPELRRRGEAAVTVLVPESFALDDVPGGVRLESVERRGASAVGRRLRRLFFDQVELPGIVRERGIDALFSSANVGPARVPCRHVLLVRNTLPFDPVALARMRPGVRAYHAVQRLLALRAARASDVVLFPTASMRDLFGAHWRGRPGDWRVAPFGVDRVRFAPAPDRPPEPECAFRLLHVSTYCDQKNLGTLLAAARILNEQLPGGYRLTLTAGFADRSHERSAFYPNFRRERAAYLELEASGAARDLGPQHHGTVPELYRSSDVFVFPSYTESFGHPLLEAMASGLAVVAADTPVNREVAADAAVYVPVFEPAAWAEAIAGLRADPRLRLRLGAAARARAAGFTWSDHARQLAHALNGS